MGVPCRILLSSLLTFFFFCYTVNDLMELKLNGDLRAFADDIAFFTQTLLILLKENLHILRNHWVFFNNNAD